MFFHGWFLIIFRRLICCRIILDFCIRSLLLLVSDRDLICVCLISFSCLVFYWSLGALIWNGRVLRRTFAISVIFWKLDAIWVGLMVELKGCCWFDRGCSRGNRIALIFGHVIWGVILSLRTIWMMVCWGLIRGILIYSFSFKYNELLIINKYGKKTFGKFRNCGVGLRILGFSFYDFSVDFVI